MTIDEEIDALLLEGAEPWAQAKIEQLEAEVERLRGRVKLTKELIDSWQQGAMGEQAGMIALCIIWQEHELSDGQRQFITEHGIALEELARTALDSD